MEVSKKVKHWHIRIKVPGKVDRRGVNTLLADVIGEEADLRSVNVTRVQRPVGCLSRQVRRLTERQGHRQPRTAESFA